MIRLSQATYNIRYDIVSSQLCSLRSSWSHCGKETPITHVKMPKLLLYIHNFCYKICCVMVLNHDAMCKFKWVLFSLAEPCFWSTLLHWEQMNCSLSWAMPRSHCFQIDYLRHLRLFMRHTFPPLIHHIEGNMHKMYQSIFQSHVWFWYFQFLLTYKFVMIDVTFYIAPSLHWLLTDTLLRIYEIDSFELYQLFKAWKCRYVP